MVKKCKVKAMLYNKHNAINNLGLTKCYVENDILLVSCIVPEHAKVLLIDE